MKFRETKLAEVVAIEAERLTDDRGFFARTWCRTEFGDHGLNPNVVQCSISFNAKKGTLRGMHYQIAPFSETKLVRCTQGSIFDVVIDLRPASPTFKKWVGITLDATSRNMLYVPVGCAHGFLTLEDESEVLYMMSEVYDAKSARGIRWNDPTFGIGWPMNPEVITERDRTYPDFK